MTVFDKRFDRLEIGIKDVNGKEIRQGHLLDVEHLDFKGTDNDEYPAKIFRAEVLYETENATFRYYPIGYKDTTVDHPGFAFNHRSSRFEIIK